MTQRLIFLICLLFAFSAGSQTIYFPPLDNSEWKTTDPKSLGWNTALLPDLQSFLETTHTKAFILLKDGKIVLEYYLNGHTAALPRYWASAGKSLTSVLVAVAESEGKLNLQDSTSKYLGKGWTSCNQNEENKIKLIHHITMTTGFDESIDFECTLPSCFQCKAVPGTRWSYHNSPYTILDQILEKATGQQLNSYFKVKIGDPIGMAGLFVKLEENNVFFSTARSMARFGLLVLNKGKWNDRVIVKNDDYIKKMTESSQGLNPAYGYLWWLNGKGQFMLPGTQIRFNGSIIPSAPKDLYAALGKNDQKLEIIPSLNLVLVRLGDDAYGSTNNVPTQFDEALWRKLNPIMNLSTNNREDLIAYSGEKIAWYAHGAIHLKEYIQPKMVELTSLSGKHSVLLNTGIGYDIHQLPIGIYSIRVYDTSGKVFINKIFKY